MNAPDANPLDRLSLTGLRVRANHGVYEHERREGQDFIIDVDVHLPTRDAAEQDDLAQTIHYGELAQEIAVAVGRDPVDLIETVAQRVADVVLAHPQAASVTVTVHKPHAPIDVPFGDVSVTITRERVR